MMFQEKRSHNLVADDLASSIFLDIEMEEKGFRTQRINPFIFPAEDVSSKYSQIKDPRLYHLYL